jgi:hypothetical protein
MLRPPAEIDRRVPSQKEKSPDREPDTRGPDEIGPRSIDPELAAREAARQTMAKRQVTEEAVKRETGELPVIDEEERRDIARRYGLK